MATTTRPALKPPLVQPLMVIVTVFVLAPAGFVPSSCHQMKGGPVSTLRVGAAATVS